MAEDLPCTKEPKLHCTKSQKIYLIQNDRKCFLYKMAEDLPCIK